MNKIRQYVAQPKPMPTPGEIRELIDRDRQVAGLGVIYGVFPSARIILIRPINLDDEGNPIAGPIEPY